MTVVGWTALDHYKVNLMNVFFFSVLLFFLFFGKTFRIRTQNAICFYRYRMSTLLFTLQTLACCISSSRMPKKIEVADVYACLSHSEILMVLRDGTRSHIDVCPGIKYTGQIVHICISHAKFISFWKLTIELQLGPFK